MTWKILPISRFSEYRDKWDVLNGMISNSPVLNSAFISNSLSSFSSNKEQLAIYEQDAETIAMSIIERKKFGFWDTFQPSQSPLGMWININSTKTEGLLKELTKKLPGIVLNIGITQQDPTLNPRPPDGKRIHTLDYILTAKISTEGTYEAYWSSRGKNLRHNLKRQRNRLEKEGVKTTLLKISNPSDVYRAICEYGHLETAGWKSYQGTAVHSDNVQGRFYTELLSEFCQMGLGTIYQYLYGDSIVASDICIHQGGTFVILKTTYDESIKNSSPAFLMRQEIFKELFLDDSISNIEFYGKVMDWHTKWSDQTRTLYHLNYRIF